MGFHPPREGSETLEQLCNQMHASAIGGTFRSLYLDSVGMVPLLLRTDTLIIGFSALECPSGKP